MREACQSSLEIRRAVSPYRIRIPRFDTKTGIRYSPLRGDTGTGDSPWHCTSATGLPDVSRSPLLSPDVRFLFGTGRCGKRVGEGVPTFIAAVVDLYARTLYVQRLDMSQADRTERLGLRVAREEVEMLRALAEHAGLSASDIVRTLIREAYRASQGNVKTAVRPTLSRKRKRK